MIKKGTGVFFITLFKNSNIMIDLFLNVIEHIAIYFIVLLIGNKLIVWVINKTDDYMPKDYLKEELKNKKSRFIIIWSLIMVLMIIGMIMGKISPET